MRAHLTLIVITIATFCVAGCYLFRTSRQVPEFIVIGVDGMDPGFVSRHWAELPNLKHLRDNGTFSKLATTTPPQSPVAWSSLITGLHPAQHGIFDFVHRDAATLQPFSSMSKTTEPRFSLPLGPFVLPLDSSKITSLRRGTPFWQTLVEHGVPATIMRMPTNYPPLAEGNALAGMGTPDLRGTLGTFTFFTDDIEETSHSVSGGSIVKVTVKEGHALLPIEGPPNPLRKDHSPAMANLDLDVDSEQPVARLKIGDDAIVLKEGEWSGWMVASFSLIPHLSSVNGTFRVFAKQLHPGVQIYISAINIDPVSPALPVSSPPNWSREVAGEMGRFSTLGISEDTSALRQQAFTLTEFRGQTRIVFEEERNLLRYSLRHFSGGFLFFYFSSVDQNSHMLWGRYEPELLEVYRAVDDCIGEVMKGRPDAELVVMSDHGFTTFERAVNLNAWLMHRGFLSLAQPPGDDTSLQSLDWPSTEAYGIGLNGLYINLQSRELHGIVPPGARSKATIANLRDQLSAWRDPSNGRQVVEAVYEVNASRQNAAVAPDLIVGYAPGYRASWQTGLGATPREEIQDNTDAWIGDHCINPTDVPGVFFSNRTVQPVPAGIQDVAPFILKRYNLQNNSENHVASTP